MSRRSSGELATTSAPEVENGLESTTEDAIAERDDHADGADLALGEERDRERDQGAEDAGGGGEADTAPPMKQITSAASSGVPMPATSLPSQSIVPISCSSAT